MIHLTLATSRVVALSTQDIDEDTDECNSTLHHPPHLYDAVDMTVSSIQSNTRNLPS